MKKVYLGYGCIALLTAAGFVQTAERSFLLLLFLECWFPILLHWRLRVEADRTRVEYHVSPNRVEGQDAEITFVCRHRGRYFAAGVLQLTLIIENHLFQTKEKKEIVLPVNRRRDLHHYQIPMEDCGDVHFYIADCKLADIFGMCSGQLRAPQMKRTTVYPQTCSFEWYRNTALVGSENGGNESGIRKGHELSEVLDIRSYLPGDEAKLIHWKLSSKQDDLLVRESSQSIHIDKMLMFEADSACDKELTKAAIAFAATLSEKMVHQGIHHTFSYVSMMSLKMQTVTNERERVDALANLMESPLETKSLGVCLLNVDRERKDYTKLIYVTSGEVDSGLSHIGERVNVSVIRMIREGVQIQMFQKGNVLILEVPLAVMEQGNAHLYF